MIVEDNVAQTLVMYNSVTGFSQTYATWIAEELQAQLLPFDELDSVNLADYDVVIYGAGVRMSKIRGFHTFRKKLATTDGAPAENVIVWANGGTPQHPDRDWKAAAGTFTRRELARGAYKYFYFEGGIRYEGLNKPEYLLLKTFAKRVQKYRDRGEWAAQVADGIVEGYDHTSREAIRPLVEYARQLQTATKA